MPMLKKNRIYFSFLIFSLSCTACSIGQAIVDERFESESEFSRIWKSSCRKSSKLEFSSKMFVSGESSLHITFLRDTVLKTKRCEITPQLSAKQLGGYGKQYWYRLNYFIPDSWEFEQDDRQIDIVGQWHHHKSGAYGGPPPLALQIVNNRWVIRVSSGNPMGGRGFDDRIISHKTFLDSVYVERGKWVEWIFQVKWSAEDEGILRVWKDGELALDLKAISNCYLATNQYLKVGMYKARWYNSDKGLSNSDYREIYIDNVLISQEEIQSIYK